MGRMDYEENSLSVGVYLKKGQKQGSHQAEMKWPWKAITHIMCLPYIPWGSLDVGDI